MTSMGSQSRVSAAIIALLSVIVYSSVLGFPFRRDDLHQISTASQQLRDDLGLETDSSLVPNDRVRFRPLLWVTFLVDSLLSGRPLRPWVFYGTSLALHGLVVAASFGLFAKRLGTRGALVPAALVALNAPGAEAVSWVAARGDLMCGLFGVLAARRLALKDGNATALALGTATWLCCAVASKETGYAIVLVLAPACLLRIWIEGRGSWKSQLKPIGALLAPVLVMTWWRHTVTDSRLPLRIEAGRFAESDLWLVDVWAVVQRVALPSCGSSGTSEWAWLLPWALGVLIMALASWLLISAVRDGGAPALLAPALGAIALVLLCVPVAASMSDASRHTMGRTLYVPTIAFAYLLGLLIQRKSRDHRPFAHRVSASLLASALLLTHGIGFHHRMSADRDAAARIERQMRTVSDAARMADAVCVVPVESFWNDIHMLGHQLPLAFKEPFSESGGPKWCFNTLADAADSRILHSYPGSIAMVDLPRETIRLLAAQPVNLPMLVQDAPGRWRPTVEVGTRGVRALHLEMAQGRDGSATGSGPDPIQVRVRAQGGREWTFHVDGDPGSSYTVPVAGWDGWPSAGGLEEVSVQDAEGVKSVALLASEPQVTLVSPADGFIWKPGHGLRFVFEPPAAATAIQLHFRFEHDARAWMRYVMGRRAADPAGRVTYDMDPRDWAASSPPDLRIEDIPRAFDALRGIDLDLLSLRWRVEGYSPSGLCIWQSPWRRLGYRGVGGG